MDFGTQRRALVLIRRILNQTKTTRPCIITCPQKPPCRPETPVMQPFLRNTPESQGISSEHISRYLEAIRDDEALDPHCVMILRNGVVISEATFGAYDNRVWHLIHSESKSITSLAVGMLIDEGKLHLDDPIVPFFKELLPKNISHAHQKITVRHLLTMTSGILFNDAGSVTERDWVQRFFESSVITEPGKQFFYNSMNTYMLSALVRQISGQNMMDYLKERLWEPLGIADIYWETCPKGIEKGGWGLYIRPEDLAKIGQMVLQNGRWGNRQILSEQWIRESTAIQVQTPSFMRGYHYGYQNWIGRERNNFVFCGMFGQNLIGYPETGILILILSGSNEMFQDSLFFDLTDQYFGRCFHPETVLPEHPEAFRHLQELQADLRDFCLPSAGTIAGNGGSDSDCGTINGEQEADPVLVRAIAGKTYITDEKQAAAVGLLPLITQAIQNNYTSGVKSLGFDLEKEFENENGINSKKRSELALIIEEADETYRLPIGFDAPQITDLMIHGEPYRVGVRGLFAHVTEEEMVLTVRVSFLEIPNTRIIRFTFHGEQLHTKWLELPGREYMNRSISILMEEIRMFPFLKTVLATVDRNFIQYKLDVVLEPEVDGKIMGNGEKVLENGEKMPKE